MRFSKLTISLLAPFLLQLFSLWRAITPALKESKYILERCISNFHQNKKHAQRQTKCVCERERENVCVCVCVRERDVCMCACVRPKVFKASLLYSVKFNLDELSVASSEPWFKFFELTLKMHKTKESKDYSHSSFKWFSEALIFDV